MKPSKKKALPCACRELTVRLVLHGRSHERAEMSPSPGSVATKGPKNGMGIKQEDVCESASRLHTFWPRRAWCQLSHRTQLHFLLPRDSPLERRPGHPPASRAHPAREPSC